MTTTSDLAFVLYILRINRKLIEQSLNRKHCCRSSLVEVIGAVKLLVDESKSKRKTP
jgi:hypothetical protein